MADTLKGKQKVMTTEEFIQKAKAVHGDKYDYSKVEYVNALSKVCIVCSEHGEFWQRASHHIAGHGCPKCSAELGASKIRLWTRERCYTEASKYTNRRSFRTESKSAYDIASKRGWLKDYTWLEGKIDLTLPKDKRQYYNQEEIIERLKSLFGDRYGYEQVVYRNMKTPITLVCHEKDAEGVEHGAFSMRPDNIFSSHQECPKCYNDRRSHVQRKPLEIFIEEARKVHDGLYEYHKVEYINGRTKVCIVCPIHGDFWQTPTNHLKGKGCPYCSGNAKRWNKETCEEAAHKYQYIFDFRKRCPGACNVAQRNGWLKDYTWLKPLPPKTDDYDKDNKYIYAYEFVAQKAVYVGLTNSIIKRDWQHRNKSESSVYQFASSIDCEIPQPKQLEKGIPARESGKHEAYWVKYYNEQGWFVLNKAATGERESSIGISYPLKWTKRAIRDKAKECGYNLKIFMEQYPGAYGAIQSRYKGLLAELFPHRMIHTHYSVEDAMLVVKKGKYKNRSQLRSDCLWAYRILYNNGLLDEVLGKPKEYSREEALREAENYRTLELMRIENHALWNYLRKNNLFRVAKPLDPKFRRAKTVEEAWEVSQSYPTIADLCNHASVAYRLLKEAGLLVKRYPHYAHKIVLQYSIDGEFIKEWPNANTAERELHIYGIGSVCRGKKKSAGGYLWKYKD